jgi:hypothetical protein
MLFKGNPRTKTSFLYMCIPLKFVNRAVNGLFAFADQLVIVVEIVNDEEFIELYRGTRNIDYLLTYEDKGTPKIVIRESKSREIIDFCIRGFIDVLRFRGKEPFRKDDELYLQIKAAVDEEINSIPRLEVEQ